MKEIIKECIDLEKKLEQRELELNEIMIERNNLLDRIDKAIEYIKENEKEYGSLEENEKIILDILRGNDETNN